jgi:small subunit ribosomal protein S13
MSNFIFRDKNLPINRDICSSMSNIYGVGMKKAKFVAAKLGFGYPFKSKNLNSYHKAMLAGFLNNILTTDIKAKRIRAVNIKILKEINTLKGKKHSCGLPVRGQRIKSNGQSQKRLFGRSKNLTLKTIKPMSDAY